MWPLVNDIGIARDLVSQIACSVLVFDAVFRSPHVCVSLYKISLDLPAYIPGFLRQIRSRDKNMGKLVADDDTRLALTCIWHLYSNR